jgi:tetratricopeptide (TPR) repeat protein
MAFKTTTLAYAFPLLLCLLYTPAGYSQDMNEIPMYGEKPKSPELLKADEKFIEAAIRAAGSKEKAAKHAVRRGWEAIMKGDSKTAMRRFNQAWLLTPDSADVYWGFGAAAGSEGKYDDSIRFLTKANEMNPRKARLMTDLAYAHILKGSKNAKSEEEKAASLRRAFELLDAATRLDPQDGHIFFTRAIALFFKQDYTLAWRNVQESEKLKFAGDRRFVSDLTTKMARPSNP